MIRAHKEVCIMPEPPGRTAKWHHLDALTITGIDEGLLLSLVREFKEDPEVSIIMEWPLSTEMTALDYRFFGIDIVERLHVSNQALARFRLRWDERFPSRTFDQVFGSWPWDHLDAFHDHETYIALKKEYGIKDCRIFLWM